MPTHSNPSLSSAKNGAGRSRASKRRKLDNESHSDASVISIWHGGASQRNTQHEQNSSEEEDAKPQASQTDLEASLPPISDDQEALDDYESRRHADDNGLDDIARRLDDRKWVKGKSSIYVDAFNLTLATVLEQERHLFDEVEQALFEHWNVLSYEAQYLYVRLFLRKTSAWHRINALGYYGDVGDVEGTISELQAFLPLPEVGAQRSSRFSLDPPPWTTFGQSFRFAESSDLITSMEEASSLLKYDELKVLAKEAKVQGRNKRELLEGLRRSSRSQSGLKSLSNCHSDTSSSTKSSTSADTPNSVEEQSAVKTPAGGDRNRDTHFLCKILAEIGPCIRLSMQTIRLFERVHLVFYRSTEWTEKSLTTLILARIARRNFPEYIVCRSANVFESRELLIEFESALRTQARVDNILETGKLTDEKANSIIDIHDQIYPRWLILLDEELRKEHTVYQSGEGAYLRRLSPAWVYTRILHKTAYVFGKQKDHRREHELISKLLSQTLFHHARRGAWYQRKALLEEHYLPNLTPNEGRGDDSQKRHWRRIALITCEDGLQDPHVHMIYHHDLQKRLVKLEKTLRIPKREQHNFSHVTLTTPVEVYIEGTRVQRRTPSPPVKLERGNPPPKTKSSAVGAKTVWLDPLEDNCECSVEAMCLSHYRSRGWKGYHSEGGIIRTLFAYLFYDVLYTYVPNVFQTAYQTCPLDLHTDAFYPTRLSEINHRLVEIGNGKAEDLIWKVWNEHFERQTCVVGLDWSFELVDLLEIATIFNGEALAVICKVMAQDYATRGGGVPDLFLWHNEQKEVIFAEVKSENDRLSDTQRLWIHVLTGAGIKVELCNAIAKNVIILD